jgi:hypothetical protein
MLVWIDYNSALVEWEMQRNKFLKIMWRPLKKCTEDEFHATHLKCFQLCKVFEGEKLHISETAGNISGFSLVISISNLFTGAVNYYIPRCVCFAIDACVYRLNQGYQICLNTMDQNWENVTSNHICNKPNCFTLQHITVNYTKMS